MRVCRPWRRWSSTSWARTCRAISAARKWGETLKTVGKLPKEWTPLFAAAGLFQEVLAPKGPRGQDTWVGTFLGARIDRQVVCSLPAPAARAVLGEAGTAADEEEVAVTATLRRREG